MRRSGMPLMMIRSFCCIATAIAVMCSTGSGVTAADAQQTSGAPTQAPSTLHKNDPMKSSSSALERKSHRLIRKPAAQKNGMTAEVKPSNTYQSGTTPSGTMNVIPDEPVTKEPTASAKNSTLAPPTTSPTMGTISQPFSLFGSVSSPASTSPAVPRQLGRLLSEMPGMSQLVVQPTSPVPPPPPPPSPPTANPAIGLSPLNLAFSAQQGGANPAAQMISVSNTGGGTLSWSASDNAAWLTLSPASGTGNGTVSVTVALGSLGVGTYSASITVNATGAATVTVPVTLTVTAAPVPPSIGLSPTSLSFSAQQGGGNPSPKTFSISNAGGGTLSWSVSDNASWLTLSPSSGTGNGTVTATVTTGTLTAATYTATVTVSATGAASQTVPITFTVAPASTTITLSPTTLTYSATQGGANPAAKSVTVTSNGSWTATSNAGWMTLSPSSGNGNGTISVSINATTAAVGSNTGTITVSGGGTTKTVAVTLTLNAPSSSSATLTWNANTESDLAGYKIYRATASGAYGAPIATIPAGTVTYAASGLQAGTTYFFVVTAYDSAGNESAFSNEVSKSIF
jgi:hypothetical protein